MRRMFFAGLVGPIGCSVGRPSAPLIVHEWGTFTSLQAMDGRTIGGINSDDEPVPGFVHHPNVVVRGGNPKSTPPLLPAVAMRLETPVIYFHRDPSETSSGPITLDVKVEFRGGWLSEYYPDATVSAPGLSEARQRDDALTHETIGSLEWPKLRVGTNAPGPKTDENVWLAPRKVDALQVTAANGESERYLFYRGVGSLDAPIVVTRQMPENTLTVRARDASLMQRPSPMWLVDIREQGCVAFRQVVHGGVEEPALLAKASAVFDQSDYSTENLGRLRQAMHAALVADGLFSDEATGLLSTWEVSYFQRPGQRLFFLVPTPWTDSVLPLNVSVPAKITRVMVGRVELVTPGDEKLLSSIAEWPNADLGIEPVRLAYGALGRFRDALLLDAEKRPGTPGLKHFNYVQGIKTPVSAGAETR